MRVLRGFFCIVSGEDGLQQTIPTNTARNIFRKEVEGLIGSPYRINEYIGYRLKGMNEEQALEKTRSKK